MIYFGDSKIGEVYWGDSSIKEVYFGNDLVWSKVPVVPYTVIGGAQFGANNYMNTGINLRSGDIVGVSATNLITSGNGAVVGVVDNTTADAFYVMSAPTNGVWELLNGSSASYRALHTGSRDDMSCTAVRNISAPLYVGDAYYGGGASIAYAFRGIIHEIDVTRSGTVIMDLIPVVRNSDSVVCLYDTVGGVFYDCGGGLVRVD